MPASRKRPSVHSTRWFSRRAISAEKAAQSPDRYRDPSSRPAYPQRAPCASAYPRETPRQSHGRRAAAAGNCAACASASTRRARSSLSASTSDFPIGSPCDFRNVYAMPPPISMASATFIRFSTTSILSETLAPPSTATNGRAGLERALPQIRQFPLHQQARGGLLHEPRNPYHRSMRPMRRAKGVANKQPVAKRGKLSRKSFVVGFFFADESAHSRAEECRRCPAPGSWLPPRSPRNPPQIPPALPPVPQVSPPPAASCTSDRACPSAVPDGRPAPGAPRGRAPVSSVGRVSRMRVSSVIRPPSSGTLKSTRTNTRLPPRSRSPMESLFIAGSWIISRGCAYSLARHELDEVAVRGRNIPTRCRTRPEP